MAELKEEEFIRCQIALGRRIHEHDGVFWEEVAPFYCKPAFIYRPFDPGEARPARCKSLFGYSHQVGSEDKGNRVVAFMVVGRHDLDDFGLHRLSSKKRNQVRRAQENCSVRVISDIGSLLERLREINIAQSERQQARAGVETPVSRYTDEADAWRRQIVREFNHGGREWWGAFVDDVLIAYMRTYQVDGVRIIEQMKAHTDGLNSYPVDALYYSVLARAAADATCDRVMNGDPKHASLNHFKEQFMFRAVEYPYYSSHAWLVEVAKRLTGLHPPRGLDPTERPPKMADEDNARRIRRVEQGVEP